MTHALPLLAALACASGPATLPDAEAVEAHDFATLKPAEASRLDGVRARYHVVVAEALNLTGDGLAQDLLAPEGVYAAIQMRTPAKGELTVEAVLRLRYIPPRIDKDGNPYPGRWRYRLEKAAVVRP